MGVTPLGLVLLPMTMLWAGRPILLLKLALVSAIFEAAAALIIGGSFGLPPAMVPGCAFISYVVLQYAVGMRYRGELIALSTLSPLLALLIYAALSVVVLPSIFEGAVMVWPQRPDALQPGFVPLSFSFGNVTQLLYLAMNVSMAVATAVFLTRRSIPYRQIMEAYLIGGYVAVGVAFWQFASRTTGMPFPAELIRSNPGWAIVEQTMGSAPRIQGSFSEPAALAFYLSGLCCCCFWLAAHGYRIMKINLLLALAILAMLLSTSTTGLATLAVGFPLIVVFAASRGDRNALKRLLLTSVALLFAAAIAIGPILILRPELISAVSEVVDATLTKSESESYAERSGLDMAAVDVVGQTYGLGVGWGSFRASSLIPGILANAGVFGLSMLLCLLVCVVRLMSRAKASSPGHHGQVVVDGFSAALCGQVCAAVLSAPTISSLAFFLQLGCVVGAAARMTIERSQRFRTEHTLLDSSLKTLSAGHAA